MVNELPICQNIEKKLDKYKKELNSITNTNINKNISQAADEESSYNLIMIYNKDKPDIIASLSIDFLFFLKGKSNQINHFNEKLLNFLSFEEKLQGKSKFNGKELVEMLENPIKYQQKILKKTDNLFDLRNNKINEFRKDIKYDDEKLKEISKFEKEKELEIFILRIRESIKNIENYIKKRYGNKVNINSLNIKEIDDIDLKEIYNIYLQLGIYEKEISNKINSFESEKKLVLDLQKCIKNYEIHINRMINQIKDKLKKEYKFIRLFDIFDEYKENLKTKIDKNKDYLQYKDIFTKKILIHLFSMI